MGLRSGSGDGDGNANMLLLQLAAQTHATAGQAQGVDRHMLIRVVHDGEKWRRPP
jgi:hypothetical protein